MPGHLRLLDRGLVQGGPGQQRLERVVSLTEYIQPVCLPAAGQALADGKICTVTGWGNTQYYGESRPLPAGLWLGMLNGLGRGSLAGQMLLGPGTWGH